MTIHTKQPVAFFDIDGTVFRSSLLIELVERLVEDKVFPYEAKENYLPAYEDWINREGTYQAYIDKVIATYLQNLKGVHYGTLADIGAEVVAEQGRHVYRYTRDRLLALKEEGYYLVAISQSPKTVLDLFCEQYGFDKVYGRIYELGPTDRFTGVIIDEHLISNKANIAKRVFTDEHFTRAGSIAVGDTEGDIPLLEFVDQPVCFNPNRDLYEYARQQDWKIVVERKDVVYEL